MSTIGVVVVGDETHDRPICQALEGAGMTVNCADTAGYAVAFTAVHQPDVVIAMHSGKVHDGLEVVKTIRGLPDGDGIAVVLIAEPDDAPTTRRGWELGADAVLTAPVDIAELVVCLRTVVKHRRELQLTDGFRVDAERSVDELIALVIELLDVAVPGAAHRSSELAAGVNALAVEFGIGADQRHDLWTAARVHELGRLTLGGEDVRAMGDGPGPSGRLTCATAALLRKVGALRAVAYIIDGMGAHWDGSGNPEFQRGQIPMRSRLLRTVADLLAAGQQQRENGGTIVDAAEELAEHAGTRYDPAVVAAVVRHVSSERGGPWRTGDIEMTAVEQLREGMILAEDMYTASGIKLLAAGTVLSEALVELVQRRHLTDPIVPGVHIRTGRRSPLGGRGHAS